MKALNKFLTPFACLLTVLSTLTLLAGNDALATEALLKDVLYQDMGAYTQLEIRLGFTVEISDFRTEDNGRLLVTLKSRDGGSQWNSAELSFDEKDRLLQKVAIEGSDRKGYQLVVSFSEPINAQLLPQFDGRQVLIKLAKRQQFRALSRAVRVEADDPYAINLESRRHSVPTLTDIPLGFAETHTIYVMDFEREGVLWHRLRMGFFDDQLAAERTLRAIKRYFPDAWIEQVSLQELTFAEAFRINPDQQVARASGEVGAQDETSEEVQLVVGLVTPSSIAEVPEIAEPAPTLWEKREAVPKSPPTELEALQDEAEAAFANEDYARAITLYTKLLAADEEPFRQQALEMLGVARELNRQLAHAKKHYQTYLVEYQNSEGAVRVQQRLSALVALDQPRKSAASPRTQRAPTAWDLDAYFSQFYQRHSLKIDDQSTVPIDGVFNDLNLMARRDGTDLDQEMRVTLSYLLDFTDNDRLNGREFQFSTAYWEGVSESLRSGVRIGRQSSWDRGILGRFDGLSYTYRPTGKLALGLTGGYLVDYSFEGPDSNRPFFGINGEYLSDSGNLSLKPFYMQQYVDGVLDRQAVGIQGQYYRERTMVFSLVDYDLHYGALNNFTLMGNFQFGRSHLATSYEHRKNPYLTTRNALMGQPFEDLSALEEAVLDLTLEELADDRTATSDTLRVALSTNIGEHWSLSADVVATDFSSTESSAQVVGYEAHKTLYSSFQVRSLDVFGRGSYSALMLRVADSETSATTSLYWDNRFRLGSNWQFYPRIRLDNRTFDRNGDKQTTLRPSLRMDYRLNRRLRFEFETGYQWSTRDIGNREMDITGLYLRAGYRANF